MPSAMGKIVLDCSSEPSQQLEKEVALKGLLHQQFRVTIKDGRVMQGMFQCIDDSMNIILQHCYQIDVDGGTTLPFIAFFQQRPFYQLCLLL